MSAESSSELSSVPTDDDLQLKKKDGILKFFSKAPKKTAAPKEPASPPRPKREPSPPHEYVLADNPDIAFIVMFRSRFTEAFPKSLAHFGPQELERDVVDTVPGEMVERFLCALLGLLLNRKQDVKAGHYNRALEEAIQTHKSQWPKQWEGKSAVSGGASFTTMLPTERLTLLKALILWALSSSDAVKSIIQTSYKQNRHDDDLNQPLSVQPWGVDSDKRLYFLIKGHASDDTHFRVYRESTHKNLKRTWWSVASDIDEVKALAEKLQKEDGGKNAKELSQKMLAIIPKFEEGEEKRKRREYRAMRKQQFKRPEPNFSMYEGRTRGKKMKYTYDDEDEDDIYSDSTNTRRSTRNTGTHTPAEPAGPTITQSGRQVKSRQGGTYGETILSGRRGSSAVSVGGFDGTGDEEDELAGEPNGEPATRLQRAATAKKVKGGWTTGIAKGGRHIEGYNHLDEMTSDEEGDASEQDYGDDEEEDDQISLQSDGKDDDDLTDEDEEMADEPPKKMIIKLPTKGNTPEKKTMIKLRLTPEKDKQAGLFPGVENSNVQAAPVTTTTTAQGPTKENIQPLSSPVSEPPGVQAHTSKPISASTEQPGPQLPGTPRSPLAFRGSPAKERPAALPPTVDVGSGGS